MGPNGKNRKPNIYLTYKETDNCGLGIGMINNYLFMLWLRNKV